MLPPLPKLRPRPGLTLTIPKHTENKNNNNIATPPPKKRKIAPPENPQIILEEVPKNSEIIEENSKTSRLLTKSECGRGGGRKRNSGSLIHSIPKFTQVRFILEWARSAIHSMSKWTWTRDRRSWTAFNFHDRIATLLRKRNLEKMNANVNARFLG